jgi:MHS family proline/betaine transporter-like MFS transporter
LVLILPLAVLSDRIGRRPVLIAGSLAFAVLGYPLFLVLNTAVAAGVELFATRVRYSGFSVGYNVCVAAFGGTTPYVVTWLTAQTSDNVAAAYYVVAAAIVSFVTILTITETAGRPLARGVPDQTFQSAGLQ